MRYLELRYDNFKAHYKIILLLLIYVKVFKIYFVCSVTEHTAKTCSARHAGTGRVIGCSVRFSSVRPSK